MLVVYTKHVTMHGHLNIKYFGYSISSQAENFQSFRRLKPSAISNGKGNSGDELLVEPLVAANNEHARKIRLSLVCRRLKIESHAITEVL